MLGGYRPRAVGRTGREPHLRGVRRAAAVVWLLGAFGGCESCAGDDHFFGCQIDDCTEADAERCGPTGIERCITGYYCWHSGPVGLVWCTTDSCYANGEWLRECFVDPEDLRPSCREVGAERCAVPEESHCDGDWLVTCDEEGWLHHERDCAGADASRPGVCAEVDAVHARCREYGAAPCDPPGVRSCAATEVLVCAGDGYIEVVEDCMAGGFHHPPLNPLCLEPTPGVPLCTWDGGAACDLESVGPPSCAGSNLIACDADARWTYRVWSCLAGEHCVAGEPPRCEPDAVPDADAHGDVATDAASRAPEDAGDAEPETADGGG